MRTLTKPKAPCCYCGIIADEQAMVGHRAGLILLVCDGVDADACIARIYQRRKDAESERKALDEADASYWVNCDCAPPCADCAKGHHFFCFLCAAEKVSADAESERGI